MQRITSREGASWARTGFSVFGSERNATTMRAAGMARGALRDHAIFAGLPNAAEETANAQRAAMKRQ